MEYINLKKRKDVLRLGIKDEEGNILYDEQGKEICLEFDLADINLPIQYNKCLDLINVAKRKLKNKFIIINKQQDRKGKKLLTYNEEQKALATKEFYKDMEMAMDLFLGQGGTRKFLNGKEMYWEIWDDISEALKPFIPKMQLTIDDMEQRIKSKYKIEEEEEEGVMKNV